MKRVLGWPHGGGALSDIPPDRRILVTLPDTPWPVDGGKRLRCNSVLRGLAASGLVDVAVLFTTSSADGPPVPPDVEVARWLRLSPPPLGRWTGAVASVARRLPVQVGAPRWDVVRERLATWMAKEYDLVWFGGLDHAWQLRGLLQAPHRIVDCDDVETVKWRAYLDAGGGDRLERVQRRVELPLWGRLQNDVVRWADAVAVCSDLDAQRLGTTRAVVVPNTYPEPVGVPAATPRVPDPQAPRLLMIANWATEQNVDSASFAAAEVLPEVRRRMPGARLRLVGRSPERIAELAAVDGVDLIGPVDDVAAELADADVVVVPMRFGGGTRLKIIEAFAHGVPVVSTALGAEGLNALDGVHLLLRDRPDEFAAAVQTVVTDSDLRARVADAGRELYRASFRPDATVAAVTGLVDRLVPRG